MDFGLIVDAHMVLEHVHNSISATKSSISTRESLYKIKIDSFTQGTAITSFDAKVPRYFSAGGMGSVVVRSDESYFDTISSYSLWDVQRNGYRDRLKAEIDAFKLNHQAVLNSEYAKVSQANLVASMALQTTISWIHSFIIYIEDVYKELTQSGRFSAAKAWNLATRLGQRIWTEVAVPRSPVQSTIKTANNPVISKVIFWAVVQSHAVMNRFESNQFCDDPSISSEYVKFLAQNTGIDSFEKTSSRVAELESEVREAVKTAKNVSSGISTASNKIDEIKKSMTDSRSFRKVREWRERKSTLGNREAVAKHSHCPKPKHIIRW
jgi:hypothetical protein